MHMHRLLSSARNRKMEIMDDCLGALTTCNFALQNHGSPLEAAVDSHSMHVLNKLLASDKCSVDYVGWSGAPPLVYAVTNGRVKMAMRLLHLGTEPRCRDSLGITAAMYCCNNGQEMVEVLSLILAKNPLAALDVGEKRESCLMMAAGSGNFEACRCLSTHPAIGMFSSLLLSLMMVTIIAL